MTSSQQHVRRGSQTPRVRSVPAAVDSWGPEALDLGRLVGLTADPWQSDVVTGGLGLASDGRWAASEVGLWVPRQNGKGSVIELVALAALFLLKAPLTVWSAHEYKTAEQGYQRLKALIEPRPWLMRRVKAIREANGEQRIDLHNGCRLQFNTRSKTALRGFTGDVLILDEAQELTEDEMAAVMPTGSARSMSVPGSQLWYFGTPPRSGDAWAYTLKTSGEAGEADLAWWDWGLDLHPDATGRYGRDALADIDDWYRANPALGVRISERAVRKEFLRLGQSFARERLGVWLPRTVVTGRALSEQEWKKCQRPAPLPPGSPLSLALDAWAGRWVIARAWQLDDGQVAVEIADEGSGEDLLAGAERLAELEEAHDPANVLIDTYGPVTSVIPDLVELGVSFTPVKSTQVIAAWGRFVQDVGKTRIGHPGDQLLDAAVEGANDRKVGDRRVLDRSRSTPAVPALMAAALARWGLVIDQPGEPAVVLSNRAGSSRASTPRPTPPRQRRS